MLTILLLTVAAFQAPPAPQQSQLPPGVERVGNGVSAPVAISKPQPAYTDQARDKGVAGEVRLTCVIDENGVPTAILVRKSLEASLDKSAIDTVSQWRFKPGMKDGKPVAVQVLIDVSFHPL
jgi:TonB family protein